MNRSMLLIALLTAFCSGARAESGPPAPALASAYRHDLGQGRQLVLATQIHPAAAFSGVLQTGASRHVVVVSATITGPGAASVPAGTFLCPDGGTSQPNFVVLACWSDDLGAALVTAETGRVFVRQLHWDGTWRQAAISGEYYGFRSTWAPITQGNVVASLRRDGEGSLHMQLRARGTDNWLVTDFKEQEKPWGFAAGASREELDRPRPASQNAQGRSSGR